MRETIMNYQVRGDIPFGNVGDVTIAADRSSAGIIEVGFTAQPMNGPEVMWFCFRIAWSADANRSAAPLRLVWRHWGNALGAADDDLIDAVRPVVRPAGEDWQRLEACQRIELPDGRVWPAWEMKGLAARQSLDVALCYPYGPDEVTALVSELGAPWRADTIGLSQEGRPLTRLSNGVGEVGAQQPGLYIVARQHAGETPGSWVLDGLLRELAAAHRAGKPVPLTWVVPLADIDGVMAGAYGKDRYPYDLNRAWGRPPMRHEALVIQRDMHRWAQRCRPALVLDSHAPGVCETRGVYCFLPDPDAAPRRAALSRPWCDRLEAAIGRPLAAGEFGRVAKYPSRWSTSDSPTFTAFAGAQFDCAALALETPYALAGDGAVVLTIEQYRLIGRRIAAAVLDAGGR
jgi:hypothetical protein